MQVLREVRKRSGNEKVRILGIVDSPQLALVWRARGPLTKLVNVAQWRTQTVPRLQRPFRIPVLIQQKSEEKKGGMLQAVYTFVGTWLSVRHPRVAMLRELRAVWSRPVAWSTFHGEHKHQPRCSSRRKFYRS